MALAAAAAAAARPGGLDRGIVGGSGGGTSNDTLEGVPQYEQEVEKCKRFLLEFEDGALMEGDEDEEEGGTGNIPGRKKYKVFLQRIADRDLSSLLVQTEDVLAYPQLMPAGDGDSVEDFVQRIMGNAQRYQGLFSEAVQQILASGEISPQVDLEDVEDILDVLERQRQDRIEMGNLPRNDDGEEVEPPPLPPALTRRFDIRLLPPSSLKASSLRQVRALDVGQLVKVKGMITRTSDVKPLLTVVTYTCDHCGGEIYQEVGKLSAFTPVPFCPQCKRDGRITMQTRGSRFVRYQELRVQELPDQVPMGHIPRSMVVHCSGATTRRCSPGDVVTIAGIFLPTRYTGYKALKAGLIADTYLEATDVQKHKKGYHEVDADDEMEEKLGEAAQEADIYDRLARSIAPEIYGHLDVKKALLLQLVGAPFRKLADGMHIRGDINVILMGDPGVAKSQLIKYIARVAPRGVYTTGKGSSGVGLTAAVMRDPVTGDMSLEGGALVMADMGVCCIDEFDKMDEGDRTAIHEVMEQQTVSIAKAGITTTLNARCSVLAAANPLYGRYNKARTMSENINLPNSLLSRFDLVFLILDRANAEKDMALARHVSFVHRNLTNPEGSEKVYDAAFLKQYISAARQCEPHVPPELSSFIVNEYVTLRSEKDETGSGGHGRSKSNRGTGSAAAAASSVSDQTVMTARQLLSILRLSQALARLRFDDAVNVADVEEAIRLTRMSKASLLDDDDDQERDTRDDMSKIYTLILDYMQSHRLPRLEYIRAEAMVVQKGWRTEQLREMLDFYCEADVFRVSADRTMIELFNTD